MDPFFRDKAAGYSDEILLKALLSISQYTPEAAEVLKMEAEERGGVDELTERVGSRLRAEEERRELIKEIDAAFKNGGTLESVSDSLAERGILTAEIEELVDQRAEHAEHEQMSTIDTPASTARIILGGVVATIVGSLYVRICFVNSKSIFYILAFGFIAQVYYTVDWISGGKRSTFFYLTVIASIVGAGILGNVLLLWG